MSFMDLVWVTAKVGIAIAIIVATLVGAIIAFGWFMLRLVELLAWIADNCRGGRS